MRFILVFVFLGLPLAVIAQDLNQLVPDPVPAQVQAPAVAFSADPFAAYLAAEAPPLGDRLVDRLQGIIVGLSPEAVAALHTSGVIKTETA